MKVGILGAGAWGTALAVALSARHQVTLWAREAGLPEAISSARENQQFLPGVAIPPAVRATADFEQAIRGDLIIAASSVAGLRPTFKQLRAAQASAPIIWLCKGFETGTAKLPHQISAEELPDGTRYGALSGPSFAIEVARGLPVALTLASPDADFALRTAAQLHGGMMRIYSSSDLPGVEVGGAVKNVMAIATGISDGLGLGHNARAALITRGLAEMARLGVALGGKMETFMGLTGMGDLILTATGDLSRNRTVGLKLASAQKLDDVLGSLGHVAEGVTTARETLALAQRLGVDMPVTRAVCAVLFEGALPRDAVAGLLAR
jgi:glycerol-3-phosphate dehydrogenase (NAD(P)+)